MKQKLLKIAKVVLYAFATILFILAFSLIISGILGEFFMRNPPVVIVYIVYPFFALVISVLFSMNHIKSLFKKPFSGQIKIRYANLIIAILLFASIFVHIYIWVWLLGAPLMRFLPVDFAAGAYVDYSLRIIYFMIWYNLIHAFRRKPSNEEKNE